MRDQSMSPDTSVAAAVITEELHFISVDASETIRRLEAPQIKAGGEQQFTHHLQWGANRNAVGSCPTAAKTSVCYGHRQDHDHSLS